MRLKRICRICNKYFIPTGKYCKLCEEYKKPKPKK